MKSTHSMAWSITNGIRHIRERHPSSGRPLGGVPITDFVVEDVLNASPRRTRLVPRTVRAFFASRDVGLFQTLRIVRFCVGWRV